MPGGVGGFVLFFVCSNICNVVFALIGETGPKRPQQKKNILTNRVEEGKNLFLLLLHPPPLSHHTLTNVSTLDCTGPMHRLSHTHTHTQDPKSERAMRERLCTCTLAAAHVNVHAHLLKRPNTERACMSKHTHTLSHSPMHSL